MLYNIIIGIYVLACILLVIVILIQAGRGGGLVEGFSGAESIFGTKTNSFIVKLTAILGTIFLGSTILMAYLSKTKSKSLMENYKETPVASSQEQLKTVPVPIETKAQTAETQSNAKSAANEVKPATIVPNQNAATEKVK
jgi:preprotein translocase subunit SecG